MNIFEKMSAITNELARVAKNLTVGIGKNSYKAVGEADILAAVKPVEEKYKVYSYPFDREVIESRVLETEKTYNGETSKGNQIMMRIATTYRFVNMEKTDEFIDIKTFGDGVDTQDKAPGKAMTYADKYALLKAYKIETGDDPDQSISPDNVKYTKPMAQDGFEDITGKTVPVYACAECGKTITEREYAFSISRFKRPLCREHQK